MKILGFFLQTLFKRLNNYDYQLNYSSEEGIFYKNVKYFTQNVILFIVFCSFKNGAKVKHESGRTMANVYLLFTYLKMLQEGKFGNEWWYILFLHCLIYKDDEGDDKM